MDFNRIAALGGALALLLAACGTTGQQSRPAEIAGDTADPMARADLTRQAPAPIPVSPFVAKAYREKYLAGLDGNTVGVFALSPNGNRFYYRTCRRPDCQLGADELAARALDRCNIGVPRKDPALRCLVFDRNGTIGQPHRFWSEADFDLPAVNPPPKLSVTDPAALAPGRYAAMTPDGQLVISLRPPASGELSGRAYFWDTGDGFHQSAWSLKDGGLCVDSVDQRASATCGTLYGRDAAHIEGIGLDLFPGKYLPVTRLPEAGE